MTARRLASLIALKEGKKSSVKIGDVREVLGILADLVYESEKVCTEEVVMCLIKLGESRAKKKKS